MEVNNRLVTVIVTVLVAVVMVASVLVPVIGDNTSTTAVYRNSGTYFAEPDGGEHTLVLNVADETVTYDGSACVFPDLTYGSFTVAFGYDPDFAEGSSAWVLRAENSGRITYAGPNNTWQPIGTGTLTLAVGADGICTASVDGGTEYTLEGTVATIADSGAWVMSMNPKILADSEFYAPVWARATATSPMDVFEILAGTTDAQTVSISRMYDSTQSPGIQGLSDSTITFDTTAYATNLLTVNSISQHITTTAGVEKDVSISYFIVPSEITYENPSYVGSSGAAILSAVPVLVLTSLVVGVVAVTVRGRND